MVYLEYSSVWIGGSTRGVQNSLRATCMGTYSWLASVGCVHVNSSVPSMNILLEYALVSLACKKALQFSTKVAVWWNERLASSAYA